MSRNLNIRMGAIALLALVFSFSAVFEASATHFRFGTYSWIRSASNPLQVTFSITEAWREQGGTSAFGGASADAIRFSNFGDAASETLATAQATRNLVGIFTDAASESYIVFNRSVTHTYASPAVYNAAFSGCCRISTLAFGQNDDNYNLGTTLDLTQPIGSDVGSPVAQAPVIVPMPISATAQFQIPFLDPDNESLTVTARTSAQSGLSPTNPGPAGQLISVSPTGLITWNTLGIAVGTKVAFAVNINETGSSTSTPLDFIIEVGGTTSNIPPFVDGASFTLNVGDMLNHTVTGGDPDSGPSALTWALNLITGPQTVGNATFDLNTQQLLWNTAGFATGVYTFFISNFDGAANGLGQILVNLNAGAVGQIPEPGTLTILLTGLAVLGLTRRRRLRPTR